MKRIEFQKMHGAGNDYIYIDAHNIALDDPAALAQKISDRHFGVGSDGLVLIMGSDIADFRMRMFNSDGSEAGMCGNASRCVGRYLYDKGLTDKTEIKLETQSGVKIIKLTIEDGKVARVSVDMDVPRFEAKDIPVLYPNPQAVPIHIDEKELIFTCVSMGNPHAVVFVEDVNHCQVERIGRIVENHDLFPERCNVEFVQPLSPGIMKMRVWERGSGETLACGTGACAALVAGVLNQKCKRKATVILKGGEVEIEWDEKTDHLLLTGGAEWVFSGEYLID